MSNPASGKICPKNPWTAYRKLSQDLPTSDMFPTIQPQTEVHIEDEPEDFEEKDKWDSDEQADFDVRPRERSLGSGSRYTSRGVRFKMANFNRQH